LENEHKEDVEASNDVEFDNGWVDIEDYSLITINEDGNMEYDGYVLLDD